MGFHPLKSHFEPVDASAFKVAVFGFFSNSSTFRLSRFLNSGVMIRSDFGELALDLPFGAGFGAALVAAALWPGLSVLGAGKLCFLSTASTNRWYRRKRTSARIKVDSRSIVPDSSFTEDFVNEFLKINNEEVSQNLPYLSTSSKALR